MASQTSYVTSQTGSCNLFCFDSSVSLLRDAQSYSLVLRQRHHRPVAFPDHKDVSEPRCKGVSKAVLHVNYVEGTVVTLSIRDDPHTTQISAPRDHTEVPHVEFDVVRDLPAGDVDSNRVVHLDGGVGVADGASVVGDAIRDSFLAQRHSLHLSQLVLEESEREERDRGF